MDFWNTDKGTELAETLIQCLPKLTKKTRQIVYTVWKDDAAKTIDYVYNKDGMVVRTVIDKGNAVVLIFQDA